MINNEITLFNTEVSEEAIQRVTSVLRSGMLNEGAVVKEFESQLNAYLNSQHAITTNSATSALHLCLIHLGVGTGDEVIVPPQTFIATGLVVLHCGARPVFADIDPLTGNLDPIKLESKVTNNTKAVIPVHWGGEPCDMDEIGSLAKKHGIAVIEDAAHAFGAEYKGRPIGADSRFACFSFQAIKGMTTGDGGVITTNEADDARGLLRRRWFGMIKGEAPVSEIGERTVPIKELGYKYHMNNICAAIGIGNLNDYPRRLNRRREIAAIYEAQIPVNDELRHISRRKDSRGAYWLYPLLVRRRIEFARAMKSRGIPVSVIDRRIDTHPVFGGISADLEGVREFDKHQIHIPIHDGMTDEQVGRVINSIHQGW